MKEAQAAGQEPKLHDFRVEGISLDLVEQILNDIEFNQLLNKRSTTWKQLDEASKAQPNAALLVANPTLIKRPVVFQQGQYTIGL